MLSYRIKVAVEYQGRELLPAEEHTLSREYSFDETQLLAKQRESDILRQALADDLAALLMHRLAACSAMLRLGEADRKRVSGCWRKSGWICA